MTRYLAGLVLALALGIMGCSETAGTGGSGGSAGTGGEGGTGGGGVACETVDDCPEADLCTKEVDCINRLCFNTPLDCDDYSDCTVNTCDPAVGCEDTNVADGAPCAGGMCQAGQCALSGTVLPCTAQGIRNAIAVGGGPYTFDCDGPTGVSEGFDVDKDVILDGEGNLTITGVLVFMESRPGGHVELRGFNFVGQIATGGSVVTLVDSTVRPAGRIWLLGQGSTAVLINSTVFGDVRSDDGGTLIMTNSTLSGGSISHSGAAVTIVNSTLSGDDCLITAITQSYTIANSVIEGLCCADVTSNGYNIESPGDTCGFDQLTDQVNVSADDLKLGPLADNGGPTMTHALEAGSVASDVIPELDCVDAGGEPLTADQRGVTRPQGPACDVGAVETEVSP